MNKNTIIFKKCILEYAADNKITKIKFVFTLISEGLMYEDLECTIIKITDNDFIAPANLEIEKIPGICSIACPEINYEKFRNNVELYYSYLIENVGINGNVYECEKTYDM